MLKTWVLRWLLPGWVSPGCWEVLHPLFWRGLHAVCEEEEDEEGEVKEEKRRQHLHQLCSPCFEADKQNDIPTSPVSTFGLVVGARMKLSVGLIHPPRALPGSQQWNNDFAVVQIWGEES